MTERPILFSGPMVRAIMAGQKIMTRRVVKPQPDGVWCGYERSPSGWMPMPTNVPGQPWWKIGGINGCPRCPYGQPGDLLWVRETWASTVTAPRHVLMRIEKTERTKKARG